MEWTDALHSNFMGAVNHLGGITNATASEILRHMVMREPGLTLSREQVNSHLQKIRRFKIEGPQRMNRKAIIHQRYLLQIDLGEDNKDDWSIFLRACDVLRHSSNNNNDNEENFDLHSLLNGENWDGHRMIEGWSYQMSQNHNNLLSGENEDNNNSYSSIQSIEQQHYFQVPSSFVGGIDDPFCRDISMLDGNTLGQDNSGGNNYLRDITNNFENQLNIIDQWPPTQVERSSYLMNQNYNPLFGGIENNNSSYCSYPIQNREQQQQQFQVPLLSEGSTDPFLLPMSVDNILGQDNSGGNYMVGLTNNFYNHQLNIDQCPTQLEGDNNGFDEEWNSLINEYAEERQEMMIDGYQPEI